MFESQEPKYAAVEGRLVNRKTGMVIPADEPVFIFRATDPYASTAIKFYLAAIVDAKCPASHVNAVVARIDQFDRFSLDNPGRMKEPD